MKTTGDVGRNVPVPARCMTNGALSAAAARRWAWMSSIAAPATGVGGNRVTCGQVSSAAGSPTCRRHFDNTVACGWGMAMATPSVTVDAVCSDDDATLTRSPARRGEEPHPVIGDGQGRLRHLTGALTTGGEDTVEFGGVVEQFRGALGERFGEGDDRFGHCVLQRPVP